MRTSCHIRLFVTLLAFWLSACNSAAPLQPTQTPALYPTNTETIATLTPTASPTLRPTRPPTQPPKPTHTPLPTPVFRPIFTEIANSSSQLTVVRVETFESPAKDWKLEITTNEPKSFGDLCHFEIKLISSNNATEWKLDEWVSLNYTCGRFEPFHWSHDKRFLYLIYQASSDGCFSSARTLQRIDLADGRIEEIAHGDNLALSSDETFLAYTTNDGYDYGHVVLVIQDLNSHNEREVEFEAEWADGVIWSPDGSHVALTLINNPCDFWKTSIVVVNSDDNLPFSVLTDFADDWLVTTAWPKPQFIHIKGENNTDWQLNVATGEITND